MEVWSCLFRRRVEREREEGQDQLASVGKGRLGVLRACLLKEEGTQLTGQASMITIKTLT